MLVKSIATQLRWLAKSQYVLGLIWKGAEGQTHYQMLKYKKK